MKISNNDVKKIAGLANLKINDEQAVRFAGQLSAVLDFIEHLKKAPTDFIRPLFNVNGGKNVFREDTIQPSLTQEECLRNAKSTYRGFFKVKSIF